MEGKEEPLQKRSVRTSSSGCPLIIGVATGNRSETGGRCSGDGLIGEALEKKRECGDGGENRDQQAPAMSDSSESEGKRREIPEQNMWERVGSRRGLTSSPRWNHLQIDVTPSMLLQEHPVLSTFDSYPLQLELVISEHSVADLRLTSPSTSLLISPVPPPFDIVAEEGDALSPVIRSWRIEELDLMIHAESWIEGERGGFIDLFAVQR